MNGISLINTLKANYFIPKASSFARKPLIISFMFLLVFSSDIRSELVTIESIKTTRRGGSTVTYYQGVSTFIIFLPPEIVQWLMLVSF